MDALMWANMAQGFEEGRQRNNNKRVEAARLFNEFKKANPDANFQDYQTFISSVTGGAPWLRDSLPGDDQLQAYAATNQMHQAQAERMQRMEMIGKQAQLSSVFERGMADNLLSTDGDTQQALERTIAAMSGGDQTAANDLRTQFGNNNYSALWQRTQSEIMDSRWDQIIQLGETGQHLTAGHLKGVLGYTPTAQQVEMANLRVNQALEAKRERQAQLAREARNSDLTMALRIAESYRQSGMGALRTGQGDKVRGALGGMLKMALPNLDPKMMNDLVSTTVDTWQQDAETQNQETLARFTSDPQSQQWVATLIQSGQDEKAIQAALHARGVYADEQQTSDMVQSTRTLMQAKQQADWQATRRSNSDQAVQDFTTQQQTFDDMAAARLNLNLKDTEGQGVGNLAKSYALSAETIDPFINRVTELTKDDPTNRQGAVEQAAKELGIPRDEQVVAQLKSGQSAFEPTDPTLWSNTKREPLARKREQLEQEITQLNQLPPAEIPLARVGQLRNELATLQQAVVAFGNETRERGSRAKEWDSTFRLEQEVGAQGINHPFLANPQQELDLNGQLMETFKALESKAEQVQKVSRGQLPIESLTTNPTEQMKLLQNTQKEKLEGLYRAGQSGRLSLEEASKLSLILSGTRGLSIPNEPDYAGSTKRLRMLENAYIALMNGSASVAFTGSYPVAENSNQRALADVVSQLKKELAKYH